MPVQAQEGFRRGTEIIHGPGGYSYHKNRDMKGGRIYVRCFRHYKFHCNGSGTMNALNEDFRRKTRHNHRPDHLLIHERRFRRAVLNRCREGDMTNFADIYHQERVNLRIPDAAAGAVPFVTLRPAMQAARAENRPNIPHTLTDLANVLQNPEFVHLSQSLDGRDNLFAGVVGQTAARTRAVLFFSRRMLRHMRKVDKVFSDGTFVIPLNLGCAQIWVLTTVRLHHIITLGWVLMQSKLTEAYIVVLQALRRLQPEFRPTEVMCDFEIPQQEAWAAVYPNAESHGCYYHHTNTTCGKANELHLTPFLRENLQADSVVRSLCAIPLLKTEHLVLGFDSVLQRATNLGLEQLAGFLLYYARTWLTPARRRVLSVYGCEDRTNNVCESHNRTLRAQIKVAHPNVFQLISAFVKMEDITRFDLGCFRRGDKLNRERRVSVLINDARIAQLTEDLNQGNITVGDFLRSASRRIQGVYDNILG